MWGDLTLEENSCEQVQSACLSGQSARSLLCGRTVASRVSVLSCDTATDRSLEWLHTMCVKDTYIFYVVHACMHERMYVLTTICCSDLMAAAEGGPRGSSVRTPLPAPSPSSAARASAAVSAMWYGLAWIHIHFSTVK